MELVSSLTQLSWTCRHTLATGLEEHALVSYGLLDWRLGHDIVLPVDKPGLAHTLDHAAGYG